MPLGSAPAEEREKGREKERVRYSADSRSIHKRYSEAALTLESCPEVAGTPPKKGCPSGKATLFS